MQFALKIFCQEGKPDAIVYLCRYIEGDMTKILYPIGIQNFERLRDEGFVYVDKTRQVYELAQSGRYYFLSRPRRFGKSLLISTMEAYFSGKRELFKGLAIERLEKDWTEHPVLHIDLNTADYSVDGALYAVLRRHLEDWESQYGDNYKDRSCDERFLHIVRLAYEKTGEKVVILVDEYDKPLLQTFDKDELQEKYRSQLKAFYSVLKTQDQYIRFAFLTGVTKFGKVSIFSDLNNLNDISMDARYSDICGISEEELHSYFEEPLHDMSHSMGCSYDEFCVRLRDQYDGYHFEVDATGVYNPFSLLNALSKKSLKDYWFETGTPTVLVESLKLTDYDLSRLQDNEVDGQVLGSVDSWREDPIPLIYQSGYLTIKDYDQEFGVYTLTFPNREVRVGFTKFLMPYYLPRNGRGNTFAVNIFVKFVKDVREGKVDAFMVRLKSLFASANYKIVGDMEKYFQNVLYLIFTMMGFYTEVERNTSYGCMDIVIKTKDFIYIIECKLDKSAQEALDQIEEKQYATPFAADPRKIYKIGINFSSETRGVNEYIIR